MEMWNRWPGCRNIAVFPLSDQIQGWEIARHSVSPRLLAPGRNEQTTLSEFGWRQAGPFPEHSVAHPKNRHTSLLLARNLLAELPATEPVHPTSRASPLRDVCNPVPPNTRPIT